MSKPLTTKVSTPLSENVICVENVKIILLTPLADYFACFEQKLT